MPDTQTLALVIAAGVAALVALRLYWVLGRRTGHEPGPQNDALPSARRPSALTPPPPAAPPASGNSLLDIQLADRDFDTAKFLSGAREAYGQIVAAFAKGDRAALRPLLSPDVFAAFDAGIAGRGDAPAAALVKLSEAKIVGAGLEGRMAEITVAFSAEFSTGPVTDVWTFARALDSGDPNWTLVATSGELPPNPE